MAYRQRLDDALFSFMNDGHRPQDARWIDTDRIDTEPGQKSGDLRIIRRRLAADPDMPAVAVRLGHLQIESNEFGRAVDAQDELSQVVRTDSPDSFEGSDCRSGSGPLANTCRIDRPINVRHATL